MKIFIMKKLFLLVSFFIFSLVWAQEMNKFFEVPLLSYTKLKLGTKILKQPVYFFNDYLSVISFRLENETFSEINLKILNEDGKIIFEKNFIVPPIDYAHWGKEYFFPLGENIKIVADKKYFLVITPQEFSSIYFYYLDKDQLLQGSEEKVYILDRLEELLVNEKPAEKILRLAFYEGKENLPPQLSNFKIEILENNKTKVSFNANEPVKYNFIYENKVSKKISSSKIDYFEICPHLKKMCSLEIEVESGSNYSYKLEARDFWNNLSLLEGEFEVPAVKILENKESKFSETYTKFTSEEPSFLRNDEKIIKEKRKQTTERLNLEKTPPQIKKTEEKILEDKNKSPEVKKENLEKKKISYEQKNLEQNKNSYEQKTYEQKKLIDFKNSIKILPIFLFFLILLFIIYKKTR